MTLDTSGVVCVVDDPADRYGFREFYWTDLSPFAQGYIEAALRDYLMRNLGPLASGDILGFSDLAPETLAAMMKDCERYLSHGRRRELQQPQDGAALWETRQMDISPAFPPITLYLGDDGRIYQR